MTNTSTMTLNRDEVNTILDAISLHSDEVLRNMDKTLKNKLIVLMGGKFLGFCLDDMAQAVSEEMGR